MKAKTKAQKPVSKATTFNGFYYDLLGPSPASYGVAIRAA